jgi:type II secretory pathway component PulF
MEILFKNLKGIAYSFILFILLTLLMSVIMKLTIIPESWSIYYMIAIITAFTAFFFNMSPTEGPNCSMDITESSDKLNSV